MLPIPFSQVDIDQLSRRSVNTNWNFDRVMQFLSSGNDGPKALCLLAGKKVVFFHAFLHLWDSCMLSVSLYSLCSGAGTGKSSTSVAIMKELLGRQDHVTGAWLGPISAVHFVKHSDQRRMDPVRMIKSISYQLAIRFVCS